MFKFKKKNKDKANLVIKSGKLAQIENNIRIREEKARFESEQEPEPVGTVTQNNLTNQVLLSIAHTNNMQEEDETSERSVSTLESCATSTYTVIPTAHERFRMRKREISHRQLQAAKKHGVMTSAGEGTYKFVHDGVASIMDASQKYGVTTYRVKPRPELTTSSKKIIKEKVKAKHGCSGDKTATGGRSRALNMTAMNSVDAHIFVNTLWGWIYTQRGWRGSIQGRELSKFYNSPDCKDIKVPKKKGVLKLIRTVENSGLKVTHDPEINQWIIELDKSKLISGLLRWPKLAMNHLYGHRTLSWSLTLFLISVFGYWMYFWGYRKYILFLFWWNDCGSLWSTMTNHTCYQVGNAFNQITFDYLMSRVHTLLKELFTR